MKRSSRNPGQNSRGFLLAQILVFAGIAASLTAALAGFLGVVIRASAIQVAREQAFQVAESGLEYYRWHLAHAPTDYQDGTGQPGPYAHDYNDADGKKIGTFTLTVTPPPAGSTVVVVKSVGEYLGTTTATRAVEATLAVPSVARFAIATNEDRRRTIAGRRSWALNRFGWADLHAPGGSARDIDRAGRADRC